MENAGKTIDIRKAIENSNNRILRSLPGFAVNILRRIICEDELNESIKKSGHLTGVPFINHVLEGWNVKVTVKGEEKIPAQGRFIFVSNHPVGGIDAMALFSLIYRHFPDVVSPANQLLNYIPNIRPLFLSVDVFGHVGRETARKLDELFASEKQVMIFPAGEVSRRRKGKISDIVWQKSFVSKAIQHKRDIIPVHISGRNSDLFYNIAGLRKLLGIKMYIETLLLPREMISQRNSTFTLTVGDVIPWQTLTTEKSHAEWAQEIKKTVYSLHGIYEKS